MAIEDSKRLITVARVKNVANAIDAVAHVIAGTTVPTYDSPTADDAKRVATAVSFDLINTAVTAVRTALATKVTGDAALAGKVDTLIGSDTGKSARTIANEELAAQLIPANAQESLDTLQEIAAWIQEHPEDASAMNAKIGVLKDVLSYFVTVNDSTGAYSGTTNAVKTYIDGLNTAMDTRVTAAEGDIDAVEAILAGFGGSGNPATVKGYVDGLDTAMDGRMDTVEGVIDGFGDSGEPANIKTYVDGLDTAMDVRMDTVEGILTGLGGSGALATAKGYADSLNTAMNTRVAALEALGLTVDAQGYIIQE